MFLRAAKTDAEEAGESTEGMANSISELREEVLALTGGAVDIQLDENTFKSTYQILQEISKVWHNLTDVSQANLLELLGGKRNSNVVAALLENFSVAEEALATSADSAGSAMAENEKKLDSINGKISIFKAQFEELSTTLIKSEFVKSIVDAGTALLSVLTNIANLTDKLGGLSNVIFSIVGAIATIHADAIWNGLSSSVNKIGIIFDKFRTSYTQSIAQGVNSLQALKAGFNSVAVSASTAQLAVGAFVAVISLINIISSAIENARQERIANNEALVQEHQTQLDNSAALREACVIYDEYNSKITHTIEEENAYTTAIETVTKLLGDKAQALGFLQENTEGYTKAVNDATQAELDNAVAVARQQAAAAKNTLIDKTYSQWEGSLITIDLSGRTGVDEFMSAYETAQRVMGKYFDESTNGYQLEPVNWDTEKENMDAIVEYYYSLLELQKELAMEENMDNDIYRESIAITTELESAVTSYTNAKAAQKIAEYEASNGIITSITELKALKDDIATNFSFLSDNDIDKLLSQNGYSALIRQLSEMDSKTEDVVASTNLLSSAIRQVAEEYNSKINGNLDYTKRPFVTPEDIRKVYPEFDGEIGTTYSQTVTIGEGEALYTLSITPILEDGTVLSQEALDEYIAGFITSNGVDGVLASDKENLIINIQPGDYDKQYWDEFENILGEIKNRHWELVKLQNQQTQPVNSLAQFYKETAKGFEELDKIYADIIDGGYFDFGSILDNEDFTKAFQGLNSYNKFISTITTNTDDIDACRQSFNNLISEFLNSSEALQGLTEDSKQLIITFLEQQGVANASAYVNNQLLLKNEELASALRNVTAETRNTTIALLEQRGITNAATIVDRQLALNKEKIRLESEGVTAATTTEAISMLEASDAAGIEREALAQLLIEKIRANQTAINTSGDIENLIALARVAGATTGSIANLIKAKELLARAEALEKNKNIPVLGLTGDSDFRDLGISILSDQADALMKQPIEFNMSGNVSYTGGTATNKAQEQAAKKQKTWFEKQLAEHQHLVAMEKETDAEYFKWLESAYKKAYKEGIIELEDYYKYEEEVFEGKKELFKDHLNDREHEAELLKEHGTQSEKVVKIYEGLIKDIDKELAAARARGLDDNDDYIQELLDQQRGYYDELFDMFKDHLDDIDHEISMRENYEGDTQAIIKLHEQAKLAIEKQIADLRAQGYTDADEQIQELQSQWHDHDNAIRDMREEAAEDAKDAFDELVEYRVDMLKQEIQDEKDALNEKLDNLREFYDKQKEMLQDQYDEEKYLEEQAEKRKSVSDIESELAMLEFDDSAWAQKRKLELREELSTAQKELDDFEEDHALDLTLDAIDDAAEAQAKQIEAQMEALDKRLNDPRALYNQALVEIVSGTHDIYREMQDYNNKHGTGNPQDIKDKYENAYKVLEEYEEIFGTAYRGVQLNNSTNYQPDKGSWDTADISGTNPANKPPASKPAEPSAKPTNPSTSSPPSTSTSTVSFTKGSSVTVKTTATHFGSKSGGVKMASYVPGGTYTVMDVSGDQVLIGRNGVATGWVKKSDLNVKGSNSQSNNTTSATPAPSLTKGTTVTIKKSATHFGSKSGGVKMASHVPGGKYTVMNTSGDQVLIGINGVATGWVKRSDIVGYARGTDFAKAGLARVFEEGYEQIFTSADGNKYKLFNSGDKVLNAKATEFLYDFAESGGAIFNKILAQMLYGNLPKLANDSKLMDIHMGDIIIQGHADNKTVSEIRRAQRDNIDYILNEFSKLNR